MGMRDSEKDRLALAVADRRKYPIPEFQQFAEAVRNYAEKIRSDDTIRRTVVTAVNGLKQVPGEVLFEADRLECLVFLGYDPNFDGEEPPGV